MGWEVGRGRVRDPLRQLQECRAYLASLSYGTVVMNDDNPADQEIPLAEGWAFNHPIHPAVQQASAGSANRSF